MSKAAKASPPAAIPKSRRLEIVATNEAEADRKMAEGALMHYPAAIAAVDFGKGTAGELSIMDVIAILREKAEAVNGGSLKDAEAVLMGQALALNTVFGELARRAAANMGEYIDAADKYMRLALKAQGQCRATLETLAAIKNPPVVFARQANFAAGPQQVNNAPMLADPRAHAGNRETERNKLLEASNGERLDTGTAGTASRSDPAMAAVGALDRPPHH